MASHYLTQKDARDALYQATEATNLNVPGIAFSNSPFHRQNPGREFYMRHLGISGDGNDFVCVLDSGQDMAVFIGRPHQEYDRLPPEARLVRPLYGVGSFRPNAYACLWFQGNDYGDITMGASKTASLYITFNKSLATGWIRRHVESMPPSLDEAVRKMESRNASLNDLICIEELIAGWRIAEYRKSGDESRAWFSVPFSGQDDRARLERFQDIGYDTEQLNAACRYGQRLSSLGDLKY